MITLSFYAVTLNLLFPVWPRNIIDNKLIFSFFGGSLMALVQHEVFIDVQVVDAGGNKSTISYECDLADMAALNTAHTTNDYILGAGGLVPDLIAITDAQVLSVRMGVAYKEDTNLYGAAGSEVERKAVISAKKAGTQERAIVNIPAPNVGIFLTTTGEDRNTVDGSDAALQAYLSNYEDTELLLLSDGEDLDDVSVAGNVKGKQVHRGSRKG